MKDKLADWHKSGNQEFKTAVQLEIPRHPLVQDAIAALVALGFKREEATRTVNRVAEGATSSEEMIRRSLREMIA